MLLVDVLGIRILLEMKLSDWSLNSMLRIELWFRENWTKLKMVHFFKPVVALLISTIFVMYIIIKNARLNFDYDVTVT